MDIEMIAKTFKISLERKSKLIEKLSEFVQENEITKQEWLELVKILEGKE